MAHSDLALILLLGTLSVTVATFLGERTKLWFMTDSGIAIIVGLVLGGIHYIYTLTDDVVDDTQQLKLFEFQPGIFTLLLLPPIIFESGYNLNHRSFFANIGPIIIFAFLGTLVAFAIMAPALYWGLGGTVGLLTPLEAMAFAALIVAVDPVATLAIFSSTGADPKLNALIFGESVLNDAVAIVLFKTVVQLGQTVALFQTGELPAGAFFGAFAKFCFIFLGSIAIGVLGGMMIALLFKLVNLRKFHGEHAAPAELICLVCLSYATFLAAEVANLSGIVAALFSGAVCVVYVQRNLSPEGAELCKTTVKGIAKLCDTIVFFMMGYGFWIYTVSDAVSTSEVFAAHPNVTASTVDAISPGSQDSYLGGEGVVNPCIPPDNERRFEVSFFVLTLAMCILSRGVSVFPMAALANLCRSKERRIRISEQAVIWFSGLRGAIALALAVEFPTIHDTPPGSKGFGNFCYQREHVVACTIAVVMCTVFIMGGFTKPMLNLCGIEMNASHASGSGGARGREMPSTGGGGGAARSKKWLKRALVRADTHVIRPVLVADYELPPAHKDYGRGRELSGGGVPVATLSRYGETEAGANAPGGASGIALTERL